MATLASLAPVLSKIIDEAEARTMANASVPPPASDLFEDISQLGPAAQTLLKQWLRWRLSQFVPEPFDKLARLSPYEVASKLKLHPKVVLDAIDDIRRIREEIAAKGDDAFQVELSKSVEE